MCTFTGNAAADPELRFTSSGSAVVNFTVLCSDRYRDKDGQWQDGATFPVYGQAWGDLAERISASVHRGDRLIVTGEYRQREYEKDGEKKRATDFVANDVGVSCRFAEVRSQRVRGSRGAAAPAEEDPWSAASVDAELAAVSTDSRARRKELAEAAASS
jgi:single-strand DNA-binding protein